VSRQPALTVVVPTLDRPAQLRACVAALSRGEPSPGELEIVLADDGGEVDEGQMRAIAAGSAEVRVVRSSGRGPAAARNAGAAAARAPLVAFTDDDCEPAPAWLGALLARNRTAPEALIGGRTVNGLSGNPYSRAAQAIGDAALAHHNGGPAGPRFFPSNNLALPAARFQELGGFDEGVALPGGEDRDLCERWSERGWPLVFEPAALVVHSHALGLRSFWRQQAAYGAGAYHHRRARAARTGERRLEPSLTSGVFAAAARAAIADRDPARLALLGLWQAANLAGFAQAALKRRSGPAQV
jgi:GT2 family glycosyltransferase